MARYSLTNESAELREQWRTTLMALFADAELAGHYLPNGAILFRDGRAIQIIEGSWQQADGTVYAARRPSADPASAVSKADRLAILACCAHQFGCWDDAMAAAHNAALSRILIETAASVQPLVEAARPVVQVAFSTDRQQTAMKFDGDESWYKYSGEAVEVNAEDGWTVYAMPAT